MRKYKGMMLEDLENALAEHAPAGGELASELPPLTIDGIPVSVDKMTQVYIRRTFDVRRVSPAERICQRFLGVYPVNHTPPFPNE